MKHVVIGVFEDMGKVALVRQELSDAGFPESDITVHSQDEKGTASGKIKEKDEGGIARFFRSLFGRESDDQHSGFYSEAVRRNKPVVSVNASDEDKADRAEDILDRCGAIDVEERSEQWRKEGWSPPKETSSASRAGSDTVEKREAPRGGVRVFRRIELEVEPIAGAADDDADFREHWTSNYGESGSQYDEYAPAYRYGSTLAGSGQHTGRTWDEIEPEAREDWEKRYPGNAWERFKDSVRYAWEKLTGSADSAAARTSPSQGGPQPGRTSP